MGRAHTVRRPNPCPVGRCQSGVAGDAFQILAFVGHNPAATVDVEPRVLPAFKHLGPLGRQEAFAGKEGDKPGAEQFLHRVHAVLGQHQEAFVAQEEPVGHKQMQMGVEVEVLSEGVYDHDDAGHALGLVQ